MTAFQNSTEGVQSATPTLSILVVDDEVTNLMVAEAHLVCRGYAVTTAATGTDALDQCKAGEFDAILMDIQMPGLDGFETTRRLREMGATRDVPILAVSAGAGSIRRQPALEAGMNDFFQKPVDWEALCTALEQYCAEQRTS